MMNTYIIGDVQGCFSELKALLARVEFDETKDRLWFVGDLVNRGLDSLGVLRFISRLQCPVVVTLGNHDLHFLAVAFKQATTKSGDTLDALLAAPDCEELCEWLRQQRLFYFDHETNSAISHAGIAPIWSLKDAQTYANEVETVLRGQDIKGYLANMYGDEPSVWDESLQGFLRLRLITNYFTRMRFCDDKGALAINEKGRLRSQPPGLLPWFDVPTRLCADIDIYFGHWAALEGETETARVFALDTGCVWGKKLTLLRLKDRARFSVDSKG